LKNIVVYIVLFFTFLGVSAQEKTTKVHIDTTTIVQKKFDEKNIDTYKKNKAFNYDVVDDGPSLYEQVTEWVTRVLRKILSWFFDDVETPIGFLLSFLKILPYIIAVIVVYLIVNFFLKVNSRNLLNGQNNKEIVHIEDEEELLNSKDLPRLIELAIAEENYRLATRYQYVLLLQQLSNKELIIWEQQKTNEDYIKEVQHKNIHTEFEEITRFYDFVWYGNFDVNYQEYQKGIESIDHIAQKIK
jgi:hypothetical protein